MALMNEVWSETTATIAERRGLFATLALGLFVPPVLHAGWLLATTVPGASPSPSGAAGFALLTTIAALWSQLAIVAAAALDAAGGAAARIGVRRLLPALGIELLVGILFGLLLIPLIVILVRSGVDLQAMSSGGGNAMSLSGADATIALVSFIVFLLVAIFVGARLLLVTPVIALERRGLRAIARSWRLTRGYSWQIIGVTMLFVVVIGVTVLAAQSVTGVAAALIAGTDSGVPAFVAALAGAAVTAALSVVAIVFTARLWRALDAVHPA